MNYRNHLYLSHNFECELLAPAAEEDVLYHSLLRLADPRPARLLLEHGVGAIRGGGII